MESTTLALPWPFASLRLRRPRFRRLGHKLIAVIGVAVTAGLFSLVTFYSERQETHILHHNERTMRNLTESVIRSLQTVMLAGYADIAQVFADRLKDVPEVVDFRILRPDGNEAFRDNRTIADVNRRRGDEEFAPRDNESVVPVLAHGTPELQTTLRTRGITAYYETQPSGERTLTFLAPILSEEKCFKCHGQANAVRGVLKLTTSLAHAEADIRDTRVQAILILVLAITVMLAATHALIRRSVVQPIMSLSRAMSVCSDGRLDHAVPVVSSDELGTMATSFNSMSAALLSALGSFRSEQDKLTTIIQSAAEGMVVTDAAGHIVLVNPAAEELIGKSADAIRATGFLGLFDDPAIMQQRLDDPESVAILERGSYVLSVNAATIRNERGAVIGSTALLRDITEARRLEERLRALCLTDGLTQLGNRRFLDQSLATEVTRALEQHVELSVMMFDIDHFKKFNDTHGHDQGDRVLKAVADAARRSVRTVDLPCRYGGEEFVVILRQTALEGALIAAERLRSEIEEMVVDGLKVTVTIGVSDLHMVDAQSPAELVEAADKALYEGKKGGRNRVVFAAAAELEASHGNT